MFKYIVWSAILIGMTACSAHDEHYYFTHPLALQKVIQQCPDKQPSPLRCDDLQAIAVRVNQLAYELKMNPQAYGKEILALQQKIAKQSAASMPIDADQKALEEHLAIVKWLESPEG